MFKSLAASRPALNRKTRTRFRAWDCLGFKIVWGSGLFTVLNILEGQRSWGESGPKSRNITRGTTALVEGRGQKKHNVMWGKTALVQNCSWDFLSLPPFFSGAFCLFLYCFQFLLHFFDHFVFGILRFTFFQQHLRPSVVSQCHGKHGLVEPSSQT